MIHQCINRKVYKVSLFLTQREQGHQLLLLCSGKHPCHHRILHRLPHQEHHSLTDLKLNIHCQWCNIWLTEINEIFFIDFPNSSFDYSRLVVVARIQLSCRKISIIRFSGSIKKYRDSVQVRTIPPHPNEHMEWAKFF